jgi:hypothetical protein
MLCCRGIHPTPGTTATMDGTISARIKTKINYYGAGTLCSINQYSFEMDDNPPSPETKISYILTRRNIDIGALNRIPVTAPILGQDFRVLFYGGISPSKIGPIAPY